MAAYPSSSALPIRESTDIEATINGYRWNFDWLQPRTIKWSVSGSTYWNHDTLRSLETQADFQDLFSNIAYYINVSFSFLGYFETTSSVKGYSAAYQAGSNMNVSFSYNGTNNLGQTFSDNFFSNPSQTAFCGFPSAAYDQSPYRGAAGDAWLNWTNPFIRGLTFESGTNGFALVLHEILHGLGLKHPFDDGSTGRPTYRELGVPFADRQWISVMSYDKLENGGDGAYSGSMPIAPMIMDVIALQYLYGESANASSGNTRLDLRNYVGNFYNTIWDADGTDTLDAGSLPFPVYAELGSFTASNGAREHFGGHITSIFDQSSLNLFNFNPDKWTWLWGEFENFNGSAFADTIVGNSLDNTINGGPGNDRLSGGEGDDTFDWDPSLRGGTDIFEGGPGNDVYVLDSLFDSVIERASEGIDTIYCGFDYSLVGTVIENLTAFSDMTIGVRFTGNDWSNRLTGGARADSLYGHDGNDLLTGLGGNDMLDGGSGIDTAVYLGVRSSVVTSRFGAGFTVTSAASGTDTLVDVERLQFSDLNLALDVNGNAGKVAKILGAVFGRTSVANKAYVGIGLHYLDEGMTYQALTQLALDARLGPFASHRAVVDLLYGNVVGQLPSAAERTHYVGLLDSRAMSVSALGVLAADIGLNADNINLAGLVSTGLPYVEYLG